MAIFLTRDVIGGISRLDQTAARIADGNLGERIRMRRADEIGDASTSFDRMTDQLQTMLERKREVAGALLGAGEGWLTELSNEDLRQLLALDRQEVLS